MSELRYNVVPKDWVVIATSSLPEECAKFLRDTAV